MSRVNEIDKVSHVRNVSFALAVAINVLLLVSYGVSAPTSNLAAVSHAVGGEGSWGGVRGALPLFARGFANGWESSVGWVVASVRVCGLGAGVCMVGGGGKSVVLALGLLEKVPSPRRHRHAVCPLCLYACAAP